MQKAGWLKFVGFLNSFDLKTSFLWLMSPRKPWAHLLISTAFPVRWQKRWILCVLFFCLHPLLAQQKLENSTSSSQQLTAEELLQAADRCFKTQQYTEAANLYREFLEQYKSSQEVKPYLPNIRAHTVISLAKAGEPASALEYWQKDDLSALKAPQLQLAWLVAICQGQFAAEEYDSARDLLGQIFQHPAAEEKQRQEVLHLAFQSFGAEGNWDEGIQFYQKHRATFSKASAEIVVSSRLFYLHALVQSEQLELAAKELLQFEVPSYQSKTWLQTQSLRWQLAVPLIDQEQWELAMQLLIAIRPHQEILHKLEKTIADIERKLPEDDTAQDPISDELRKQHQEYTELQKAFEAFENFDAIVRLRLANCFQALERHREAAFILDHMIRQMPASEITESGCASLIRLWILQDRWSRAIRCAELYEQRFETFEKKTHHPEILFLKGQAYQGLGHFQEAAKTFAQIQEQFPDHEWAHQARFLEAHQYLHLHQEEDAIARFSAMQSSAPTELKEEVSYWLGMSHYFHQNWKGARECYEQYLHQASFTTYRRDVEYRIAYTYFSEAHFEEAISHLKHWQKTHASAKADDALNEETWLTLGDANGAIGELDLALEAYKQISAESKQPSLFDEAQFKIAHIHKVQKQEAEYVNALENFLEARPQSPKIAEALHALGKYYRSQNQLQKAQQGCWDSITRLGNLEDQEGLEEMMLTLLQWQTTATHADFSRLIDEKLNQALLLKQPKWEQRLYWFKVMTSRKFKSPDYEKQAQIWRNQWEEKHCSAKLLLDFAEIEWQRGDLKQAKHAYLTLRKWHPKSLYRDRAWLGLANLAFDQKDFKEAALCFEKFNRYTLLPKTPIPEMEFEVIESADGAQALLRWAQACFQLEEPQDQFAEKALLGISKHKKYPAKFRAEALFTMAEHLASKKRDREAIAYYEQVYLLYPSHQPFASKSYLGRAQSLRKLELHHQAKEVYEALLSLKDEASADCRAEAAIQLATLKIP